MPKYIKPILSRGTALLLALALSVSLLPVTAVASTDIDELQPLFQEIIVQPGQLIGETCEIVENEIYGYVVDYELKKGHILSISDTNYVFSVRQLVDGNYSTMLKQATTASFTAAEDMTVGMLIRKPDKSALTAEELASIVIYDSQYGMIGVEGYAQRFTVEVETIDGGTATTRCNIFLPKTYTEDGTPTKLIVMTNGYSAYLTDSVWNGNTADNVGIIRNYLNAGYAVYVVDNTAGRTSKTPDIGCPQLVSSYRKAYEYIQKHFNVEEKFSIHSRSFGTFAAMRLMQEIPELIKCAVMTGPRVSVRREWSGLDKVFIANRFGFADTTGVTYEADKMVGHDPYTDADGEEYTLPPTYWVMCEGDATAEPLEVIEKLLAHGNDVTSITHAGTDHTGVCTLNTEEMFSDALTFLERYQEDAHTHNYTSSVTAPTCTEQGYTTYTCACGDSYTDDYADATGEHSFGDWIEIAAPACDAEGKDRRTCALCGESQYRDTRISGDPNKILVSEPVEEGFYSGKKIVFIGDSITYGVGVENRSKEAYPHLIAELLDITAVNLGVSGSGYCTGGRMATNKTLTEANIRDADVVTIMLGINDWAWSVKDGFWNGTPAYYDESETYYQLGEFGSDDTSTFYGALKWWCETIVELKKLEGFEEKQFVVITPMITSWNNSMGGQRDWDQNKTNVHGHTLRQYCTAILEVCAEYDIPVFDANIFSGIYYKSAEDNNVAVAGGDGVHVNAVGHALLADALAEFLLEGYSYENRTLTDCGHSYESSVTAPTCTEDGYTTYRCSECHYSYADDYADATGEHSYEDGVCVWCDVSRPVLTGKTISILGDSISTFTGVSNNAQYNATLSGGAVYYGAGTLGVYQADTWWQQVIDALDMELLVNNSWSGSCVLHTRSGTAGAYVNRCVQLHNDTTGKEPDVIAVFLGTNDFSYYQNTLGSADIDYAALITDHGDGTYTYAEPATTCQAYAIMLHKIKERYPDAEVYCMTMTARRDPDKEDGYADVGQPTAFNAELTKIIEHFDCVVVDLENCGIEKDAKIFDTYMGDGRVHPNAAGMDRISLALIDGLMGTKKSACIVSYDLANVTADAPGGIVLSGDAWSANLTAAAGFDEMTVCVTMGGEDITSSAWVDGILHIPSVTADVVVTATANIDDTPDDFRWEMGENDLVCTTGDNALTRKAGTVTDGVINNAYYGMEVPVILRHDQPWMVEWKASGSWSGMIFSANSTAAVTGNSFLFKTTSATGFIGFGERVNGTYENYGVALAALGIDTSVEHVYRVENRIAADGANMAYLFVDGIEIGPMNNFFVGGTNDQGQTVDWLNGRDFCFSYVGASSHTINNCKLDYVAVWEGGHTHTYKSAVTAPTCTQQGYTTYTCACGDSYVDDCVDALGHSFGDWELVATPTYTQTGLEQRVCAYGCGTVETQIVPATGPALVEAVGIVYDDQMNTVHLTDVPEGLTVVLAIYENDRMVYADLHSDTGENTSFDLPSGWDGATASAFFLTSEWQPIGQSRTIF